MEATTPHAGQPPRFDFGWVVVKPDMSATPWSSPSNKIGAALSTMGFALAAVVAVLAASLVAVNRLEKGRQTDLLPDTGYKNLQASPARSLLSTACPSTPAASP